MLAKWERVYRIFFYGLLAAVATLVLWMFIPVLWEALVTGGWRPRAAFVFLVGWYITVRLAARTNRFRALVSRWQGRSLVHAFCFNLFLFALPVSVFAYLAPLHDREQLLLSNGLMLVLVSVVGWLPGRGTRSSGLR
jgi:hypothetical protein